MEPSDSPTLPAAKPKRTGRPRIHPEGFCWPRKKKAETPEVTVCGVPRGQHRPVKVDRWQALWDVLREAASFHPPHQPPNTFTIDQAKLAVARGLLDEPIAQTRAKRYEGKQDTYKGKVLMLHQWIATGEKRGYWARLDHCLYEFRAEPAALELQRFKERQASPSA